MKFFRVTITLFLITKIDIENDLNGSDDKTIHFYHDVDIWELYDLEKDPNELNNVYNNRQYSETQERLIIKLADLQEQYKDTDRGKEFLQKTKQIIQKNN